ncbi:MAG: ChbG/HpnK family deacetylase [Cyclobacteriaceae bacterium]|nr:ChbG/HpnK family deacetylase [Cyclobacteriaceae bacterium HetDA_MAG_MS6]
MITRNHKWVVITLLMASLYNVSCSQSEDKKNLLIRCDDIGISHATNMALQKIMQTGMNISAGLIVPSPWFSEAVEMLKNKPNHVAIGIHLTANSEWNGLRWRPITGATQVPSLVDELGYFKHEYIGSWTTPADPKELKKEFRAQIQLALDAGLQLDYLDGHMGAENATEQHAAVVQELAEEFGLAISGTLGEVKSGSYYIKSAGNSLLEKIENSLSNAPVRVPILMVAHPSLDTPEMHAVHLKGEKASSKVADSRNAETELLTSKAFQDLLQKFNVQTINYRQIDAKAIKSY